MLKLLNTLFNFLNMSKLNSKLERLKKIFKRYPVNTLYLFGSQAKKKVTLLSDIDLAVQLESKIKKSQYFDFQIKLTSEAIKALTSEKVDLLIINNPKIPLSLRYAIIKEGKILFSRKEKERICFEVETMRDYLDRLNFENYYFDNLVENLKRGKF